METTFLTSQDDCSTNCNAPLVISTCMRTLLGTGQALAEMAQQSLLGWIGDEEERHAGVSLY